MTAPIFISYSSRDQEVAQTICSALEKRRIDCWIASRDIRPGENFQEAIVKTIRTAKVMVLVFSDNANNSDEIKKELALASQNKLVIIPAKVEDVVPNPAFAYEFATRQWINLYEEWDRRIEQLGERISDIVSSIDAPRKSDATPHAEPGTGTQQRAKVSAAYNIPVLVPEHFLGREDSLTAIEQALGRCEGRVAIAVLHGLRGVGKTMLAAAYAERHRSAYRATWWIGAHTDATMHADLVALGVRLKWIAGDDEEQAALAAVMERLRDDGKDILLIYDNAPGAAALRKTLPRSGVSHVLVTSNERSWRSLGEPVEIRLSPWPVSIGADYLVARTGRMEDRAAAEALSDALGGLPLAHEQAGAYCEDLDIGLADYHRRFDAAAVSLLDETSYAPADYHPEHAAENRDRLTVAGTFRLAIEEAAKRRPAAEALIVHAALLAPEPIPLFLFSEAAERLAEPLRSALVGSNDELDRLVAALRGFALVDRESIVDERDPTVTTDCIRLHRLVRQVAAARRDDEGRADVRCALLRSLVAVYPEEQQAFSDPKAWLRARRLDAIVSELVGGDAAIPKGAEVEAAELLNRIAEYRSGALAGYPEAARLHGRALALREQALGPDHPETASSLINLGRILHHQGDFAGAAAHFSRALAINEKVLGPEHSETANSLDYLGRSLRYQGDLAGAKPLMERALAIREKLFGTEHFAVAASLNSLALLLKEQGDLDGARRLFEQTLSVDEKISGPEHPETTVTLVNLASLLRRQGDLDGARPLFERALAIRDKVFGPGHAATRECLDDLIALLRDQGDLAGAQQLCERSLHGGLP